MAVGLAVAAAPSLGAQQQNVDFTISGTSTIRGWTCTAKGTLAVQPGSGVGPAVPGFPKGVQAATLTVPVKAFTCPNAEMTEHLMQAMHPEKFAEIVYKIEKYEVTGDRAQASGTMTIHGSSQPFTLPVVIRERRCRGRARGQHPPRHDHLRRRAAGGHARDAEGRPTDPHRVQGRGHAVGTWQ